MNFLHEPDPDWPLRAATEIKLWHDALGPTLLVCHHIGSTSVPGLVAKPIIDLLPVVTSLDALRNATPKLVAAGYEAMGPFGLAGRLYFRKSARDGTRLIQAHAYEVGDLSIARHLAFRDMLRVDPHHRAAYDALKRDADARSGGDINTYMDLKDPWIKTHEAIALQRVVP